jgi:hypothetical protein
MAWKMSRLISFDFYAKPIGCKYKSNYLVSQNIFQNIF